MVKGIHVYRALFRVPVGKKWLLRFFVAALILGVGAYAMVLVGKMTDASIRRDLLDLTKAVAASIDYEDVKLLSGTAADLQTDEYEYLKIGMTRIREEVPNIRFAYLLGLRDGQVLIYVDSEPVGSPDYSAPGEVYYEAPAVIAENFAHSKGLTVGPYTDRWGTWISSYSPIIDPNTGEIHAYLGLDISESTWLREMWFQQALVVATTFLLLILFLISLLLRDSRKDFLEMVRSEGEKLRLILEQLPVGILLADAGTRTITYANQKATELLGQDVVDTRAEHENDVVPYGFLDLNEKPIPFRELPLIRTIDTGQSVYNYQHILTQPGGKRLMVQATSIPIKKKGVMRTAVLVFEDITKEKEAERMKSEFVSMVSHQLRTPATAIRWLSEIMLEDRDKTLTKEQKEYLKQIHDGNQRMTVLLMDLLDISRVEAGKGLVMAKAQGDLASVINLVFQELKPLAAEKDVRLKMAAKFPKTIPAVFDPVKIKQVLQNLLENAVKYSETGGVIVLGCDASDPKEYVFSVKDEGVGIPLAQQPKIFERFFRASNAKRIANSGTGLGLYIAKVIVENHGGRIWFDSKENEGTTFSFSIPRT